MKMGSGGGGRVRFIHYTRQELVLLSIRLATAKTLETPAVPAQKHPSYDVIFSWPDASTG